VFSIALVIDPATATPASGATTTLTVTAHRSDGGTDPSWSGRPVLSTTDTHFEPVSCTAAAQGVSTCRVVFGDLGGQALTATDDAAGLGGVAASATVQPTALTATAAPTSAREHDLVHYVVAPVAGVDGARLDGYRATQHLTSTGAGDASDVVDCAGASCDHAVSFPAAGTATVTITDSSTPQLTTPAVTTQVDAVATWLDVVPSTATPVSGSPFTVTVTAREQDGSVDTGYDGAPRLSSDETHAAFGDCSTPSDGVVTCTDVVAGDLGAHTLTVTDADGVTGGVPLTTRAAGLRVTTAPARVVEGTAVKYVVTALAGVAGATVDGYRGDQRLTVSGVAGTGDAVACAGATCGHTATLRGPGVATIAVGDDAGAASGAVTTRVVRRTAISLTAPARSVAGQSVSVRVRLTADGVGRSGARITIAATSPAHPGVVTSTSAKTGADGTVTVKLPLYVTSRLVARFAGDAGDDAATSRAVTVVVAKSVGLASRPATLAAGQALVIDGVVVPQVRGALITLCEWISGACKARASARLASDGSFRLSWRPPAGRHVLSVLAAATTGSAAGSSSRWTLQVH